MAASKPAETKTMSGANACNKKLNFNWSLESQVAISVILMLFSAV